MVLYFRNVHLDLPKIFALFWTPVLSRHGEENLTSRKNHLVHLWPTSFIQANYVQPPNKIFPIRWCCWGQNKNNYVIWYYRWRILCGLHNSILYSFLIAGHTKYSPDWCFGLVKQSFRRRYVSSLFDLMEAVDKSTVSGDNVAKLCGLHDGTVLVPVYDSGQLGLILICGL